MDSNEYDVEICSGSRTEQEQFAKMRDTIYEAWNDPIELGKAGLALANTTLNIPLMYRRLSEKLTKNGLEISPDGVEFRVIKAAAEVGYAQQPATEEPAEQFAKTYHRYFDCP